MPKGVYIRSAKLRAAMSASRMGKPNPNKGKPASAKQQAYIASGFSASHKAAISAAKRGKPRPDMVGPLHPMWKGDSVGYSGAHIHAGKFFTKPAICQICKVARGQEWARLISGLSRDPEDWAYLCRPCHRWLDKVFPATEHPRDDSRASV